MARKRMIDPSFWRDEKIAECTYMERLLFQGLWTFAEDNGVGRANPKLIKADVFPYDTLRDSDLEKSLDILSRLGLIILYEADEQRYYMVKNFKKHQTINKPTPCTLPLPESYGSTTVALPPKRKEDKLKEDKLKEDKGTRATKFIPPSLDDIKAYCVERKNSVDPKRFFDYFEASGWIDSKGNSVKNWKQKIITWEGGTNAGTNRGNQTSAAPAGDSDRNRPRYGYVAGTDFTPALQEDE